MNIIIREVYGGWEAKVRYGLHKITLTTTAASKKEAWRASLNLVRFALTSLEPKPWTAHRG